MDWVYLRLAGVFEIGLSTFLKLSDGFTRPLYTTAFVSCSGISFWLLTRSLNSIPIGTAYAVWTGIGAFGTALVGIYFFSDSASFWRLMLLLLLIASIIGLKFVD